MRLLSLALVPLLGLPLLAQTKAKVTVIHGVPGLSGPVDVSANGGKLFSFDFKEVRGPLELDPATYKLAVSLGGKTLLSLDAKIEGGKNYTVVAHLEADGSPTLAAFVNDDARPGRFKARVIVRHLAKAPAVDVLARRWWRNTRLFENVANGQEGAAEVYAGTYEVSLNAAGTKTRAFGPARLDLEAGKIYAVHAVGELGTKSFGLVLQPVDVAGTSKPALKATVGGKACGGMIAISTKTPEFDEDFEVSLSGGTPNSFGFLHTGLSDSRLVLLRLPLSLELFGAKGCMLYQSTEWIRPVRLDAKGEASVTNRIPSSWGRWFKQVHYQYSFSAPGKNRLGLLLTDYASVEKQ